MKIDFEKLNRDARALGIKVNENSDNPGIYYIDDNGERVKWDFESEFRRVHEKIENMSQEEVEHLNEKLREANETDGGWSGLNIILPEDDEDENR